MGYKATYIGGYYKETDRESRLETLWMSDSIAEQSARTVYSGFDDLFSGKLFRGYSKLLMTTENSSG